MHQDPQQLQERFSDYARSADTASLRALLNQMAPQDAAEAFEELEPQEQSALLDKLEPSDVNDWLPHLPAALADVVLQRFPKHEQRQVLEEMWDDELADFLQEVPDENRAGYIDLLDAETQAATHQLLQYPENSAGGRMTRAFATLQEDLSVQEAIDRLAEQKEETEILARIYVVDDHNRILGRVRLRDLTFSPHNVKIGDVMTPVHTVIRAEADQEEAANMMLKYDLVTLPVVDEAMHIVGVITHDDAMEILQEESTEDLEMQSGIAPQSDEIDYLDSTVLSHFRRRFLWVLGLALLAILSGFVLLSYESVLNSWFLLALYMPMVVATGGNTGAQAATTVIRAMSLGEVEVREFVTAVWKEMRIGLSLGLLVGSCVALLTPIVIQVLPTDARAFPPGLSLSQFGLTVAISLAAQVTASTTLGAALPILAKVLEQDPAVVASPAITTVVDVSGLIIYFTVAKLIMGGALGG